ncbi:MAG: HAD-IIIA family hydrolase [Phycisphaerae bacterium]|nr:HAD-IIIA family hydrolase [Phycisphaerae bacterium]
MNQAVFIDRDNTLIRGGGEIGDPDDVELLKGSASAIASLRGLGYRIVVVSNQEAVAHGTYGEEDVDAVNQRVAELVRDNSGATIDRFYYCPYDPEAVVPEYGRDHPWRKPKPGMLLQAADDLGLALERCWTVGDEWQDVEAGRAAGTRTILLTGDRDEPVTSEASRVEPNFVAGSLVEAARVIGYQRYHRRVSTPDPPDPVATEAPEAREPDPPADEFEPPQVAEIEIDACEAAPTNVPEEVLATETESEPEPEASIPSAPVMDEPLAPSTEAVAVAAMLDAPVSADEGDVRQVLEQIQRELKSHRADFGDFSMLKMSAALVQMLVVGCVLFALLDFSDLGAFLKWFAAAILGQGVVITLLLLHWNR